MVLTSGDLVRIHLFRLITHFALLAAAVLGGCVSASAQTSLERHPVWGEFEPGTSVTMRIVTRDGDESGDPATVSESRTTLVSHRNRSVVLEEQVTMTLGDKQFQSPSTTRAESFWRLDAGQELASEVLPDKELQIGSRVVECHVRRMRFSTPAAVFICTVAYNAERAPHVFEWRLEKYDLDETKLLHSVHEKVTSLSPRCNGLTPYFLCGYQVDVLETTPTTRLEAVRYCVCDVPGGVYREESFEYDTKGVLLRKTEKQVTDLDLKFSLEERPIAAVRFGLFRGRPAMNARAATSLRRFERRQPLR